MTEQPPPTGRAAKQSLTPDTKCQNCGAVGKHVPRDCPHTCGECGLNCCPGARHMACAAACDIPPSKRSDLTNFFGRELPSFVISLLDKAWKTKHPGKEIALAERQREISSLECVPVDDDSDAENGEPNIHFGLCHP